MDLIVLNIGLLATPTGSCAGGGERQRRVELLENAFLAVKHGKVAAVGRSGDLSRVQVGNGMVVVDAGGRLVTPGLVDPHTHLIFSGWRQKELSLKLKGAKYLDILKMGGGILWTVRETRNAPLEQLVAHGVQILNRMLEHGTTTCEAKSGYGLSLEGELKCLGAIVELRSIHPVEVVPTFMGAHAVPEEYRERKEDYVKLVAHAMIPRVAELGLAEFCDVFCEEGVFGIEESRYILQRGKAYGLKPKLHADEMSAMGGAQLAAEVGAVSADHLVHTTEDGIHAMARSGVVAVLLPGTSYYLDEPFARARQMIEAGLPVALATDFNPGSSPNESLQPVMNLACLKLGMTPEEVLTAVTLNAAAAIDRAHTLGTLEPGKWADMVIWDAPDLDFLCYHYGTNLVSAVIKRGRVVFKRQRS
ncbi:MAG: imidazolonepropionase [Bacillota bacterium]